MVGLTALLAQPQIAAGNERAGAAEGYGRVQLAGIQFSGQKGQKDENSATMTRMIRAAAAQGAGGRRQAQGTARHRRNHLT